MANLAPFAHRREPICSALKFASLHCFVCAIRLLAEAAVARVLGAKSFRDIGNIARLITVAMHLLTIAIGAFAFYLYYRDLRSPGFFGTVFSVMIITYYLVPILVIAVAGFSLYSWVKPSCPLTSRLCVRA